MIDNYELEKLKESNANLRLEKESLSLQVRRLEEKVKKLEENPPQTYVFFCFILLLFFRSRQPVKVEQPQPKGIDGVKYFSVIHKFQPIVVSEPSGARCMDYHRTLGLVIACRLQPSPMTFGMGFGLRRVIFTNILRLT